MGKPIIYLYFHSKILSWKGKELTEKEFKTCFFQWRIPKNLRHVIMKEMEKMGLIKKKGRTIHINDYYFDEEDFKSTDNHRSEYKDGDTKNGSPYLNQENL